MNTLYWLNYRNYIWNIFNLRWGEFSKPEEPFYISKTSPCLYIHISLFSFLKADLLVAVKLFFTLNGIRNLSIVIYFYDYYTSSLLNQSNHFYNAVVMVQLRVDQLLLIKYLDTVFNSNHFIISIVLWLKFYLFLNIPSFKLNNHNSLLVCVHMQLGIYWNPVNRQK